MKEQIYIGIDPGTNTGMAVWYKRIEAGKTQSCFLSIETLKIHKALSEVNKLIKQYGKENVRVHFEDARQRKWYGNTGREKLQGAGSIKRDSVIWQDFLTDAGVEFHMIPPRNIATKMSQVDFVRLTKWPKKTSNHARDAAALVFGF